MKSSLLPENDPVKAAMLAKFSRPETEGMLAQAEQMLAAKKAAGWTKQDFAAELACMLGEPGHVFVPKAAPEYLMSEEQAQQQLTELAKMLADCLQRRSDEAACFAVLLFKVARHLEWVQTKCPALQGDGSKFVEFVHAHAAEIRASAGAFA